MLNCRATPNGKVTTRLPSGWIVTAVFPDNKDGDAIVVEEENPWLKVMAIDPSDGKLPACWVRANSRYIAPINADYIREMVVKEPQ